MRKRLENKQKLHSLISRSQPPTMTTIHPTTLPPATTLPPTTRPTTVGPTPTPAVDITDIVREIEEEIEEIPKPRGTKSSPAVSCKEILLAYPDSIDGKIISKIPF